MDDRELQEGESERPATGNKRNGKYIFGVFYFNPEDPALMVPMKFGRGIDFNYARWPAKLLISFLVVGTLLLIFELVF